MNNWKSFLHGVYFVVVIMAWIMGTVSGMVCCIKEHAALPAIAVLALGAMAWPYVRDVIKKAM